MHDEKRSAVRRNVSLDILINCDFLDPRRWRTRDIGVDSIFVKMAPAAMMPGTWVEAVLLLECAGGAEPLCLPAEIIRVSGDGLVLKFYDEDSRASQMLRELWLNSGELRQVPPVLHMSQA